MPRVSTLKLPPIDLGKESLGNRIVKLRKLKGYSQTELADKIGLNQVLVSDYELDKIRPYPEMLARFALALGVSTDELLGLKKSKKTEDAPSLKIMRRMKKIEALTPAQQRTLLQSIDMFIKGVTRK